MFACLFVCLVLPDSSILFSLKTEGSEDTGHDLEEQLSKVVEDMSRQQPAIQVLAVEVESLRDDLKSLQEENQDLRRVLEEQRKDKDKELEDQWRKMDEQRKEIETLKLRLAEKK